MSSLKVPYIKQPRGSVWCGPACAAMVMAYWRKPVGMRKLALTLPITKKGIRPVLLGQTFLRHGFRVTLMTWLRGMEPRWRGLDSKKDPRAAKRALEISFGKIDRSTAGQDALSLLSFLQEGGRIIFDAVQPHDLVHEVRACRPVILCFSPRILERYGRADSGHYTVVTGIDRRQRVLITHDPSPRHPKKPMQTNLDDMMLACHLWQGCSALFVRP